MEDYKIITLENTLVVSDLHLADAEKPHPHNPLWKKFKSPSLFIDSTFKEFLTHMQSKIKGPIELVMNGDIFDFDSIMAFPEGDQFEGHKLKVNWLERL